MATARGFEVRTNEDGRRLVTVPMGQIVAGLAVGAVLALSAFMYGLGTQSAVANAKIQALQEQVDSKVGKAEFFEFRRSVDANTAESKLLRDELQKTREELSALSGPSGRSQRK